VAAANSDAAYVEFEEALANVLAEHPQKDGIARRSRLAKARAAVDQNDPRYLQAINRAFAVLIE